MRRARRAAHEQVLRERLELPPGEDHFVLVAEEPSSSAALFGYISGGGSRDEDRKGSAEIYELVVAPVADAPVAAALLLQAAITILAGAGYDQVGLWLAARNSFGASGLEEAGFAPDGATRAGARRYSRVL